MLPGKFHSALPKHDGRSALSYLQLHQCGRRYVSLESSQGNLSIYSQNASLILDPAYKPSKLLCVSRPHRKETVCALLRGQPIPAFDYLLELVPACERFIPENGPDRLSNKQRTDLH